MCQKNTKFFGILQVLRYTVPFISITRCILIFSFCIFIVLSVTQISKNYDDFTNGKLKTGGNNRLAAGIYDFANEYPKANAISFLFSYLKVQYCV